MAQHDKIIGPGTGAEARMDINAAFAAMASSSAGPSEPPNAVPGQLWFNSTTDRLYIRNKANTAWVIFTSGFDPTDVLTKAAADARYMAISNVYDKSASDARFVPKGTPYTRAEIDAKFNPLVDPVFTQTADTTKRVHFDNSLITAGQDRAIRAPMANGALGAWELIASEFVTGAGTKIYTGLSPFLTLSLDIENQWPTTAGALQIHFSSDNGATWYAGNTHFETYVYGSAATSAAGTSTNETALLPSRGTNVYQGLTLPGNGARLKIRSFNKARWTRVQSHVVYYATNDTWVTLASTTIQRVATAWNALRISPISGTPTWNGRVMIHGIRG